MTKKLTWTGMALVAVFAIAVSAMAYTNYAMACDKEAKTKNASVTSSRCTASAAATTASASGCDKAAKTASASGCDKAAKTASADCCKGMTAEAGYSKASNGDACCKSESAAQQAALKKIVTVLPYGERHRVVVAGTMECGHCTYQATTRCQPLLKTADGKVYPLIHDHMVKDMRHGQAGTFEISSNVKLVNGIKHLEVKSYRSL